MTPHNLCLNPYFGISLKKILFDKSDYYNQSYLLNIEECVEHVTELYYLKGTQVLVGVEGRVGFGCKRNVFD